MIKFEGRHSDGPIVTLEIPNDDANLDEVFESFRDFIICFGYQPGSFEKACNRYADAGPTSAT